jgi:hypothetical protein
MSEKKEKMYLPPEEYQSLVRAESGTPLTDIFPDGILVSFKGDEITDIQHGSGIVGGRQLCGKGEAA